MYYSLKCKKYFQIKVFYFIYHQFHHSMLIKSLAVRPLLTQCTEYIAYTKNPGTNGNLLPCQIGRITASIVIFMMIKNTLKNKIRIALVFQFLIAKCRMHADIFQFLNYHGITFLPVDIASQFQLSYVVKHSCNCKIVTLLMRKSKLLT